MTTNELRENRTKLWNSMTAFLDSRRDSNGILSAEDDASYAKMEADLNALTNEIKRSERNDELEKELNKPVNSPILGNPVSSKITEKVGRASDDYKRDFAAFLRTKHYVSNVLEEGVDANGGYLVPTEFEKRVVGVLTEENVMRKLCKVITTNNERKIPVAATHSVATWTAENAAYTESNPTFGQKTIDAYKLTDTIKVSIELLEDGAFDLESYIANELAYAFGVAEEEAFCVGTGPNGSPAQPTGLFTANGGEVGVTTAGAAPTADEIISLVYALKSVYRRRGAFLMNDATVSVIRKLKDGNGVYLWQPALSQGQPDKLLGYDLYTSSSVPTIASAAYVAAFGDFQNYWIADRSGLSIQRLNELYSQNGQVGFTAYKRTDGKIIVPEGIQLMQMKA